MMLREFRWNTSVQKCLDKHNLILAGMIINRGIHLLESSLTVLREVVNDIQRLFIGVTEVIFNKEI
jgi:hypothetical protein